ncbi:MAG: hypothetical protein E7379_04185 [Clostridiales bacterium]|nr:hypothetical protein [Clostridiales bacterium]
MKNFIDSMENLPLWAKILLALPALDIIWVVYRLCKSIKKENTLGIVLAIVLMIVGIPFLWLIDIITLAISNYVIWID